MKSQVLVAAGIIASASAAAFPKLQLHQLSRRDLNSTAIPDYTPFNVFTILPDTMLQYGTISASNGALLVNSNLTQGAVCNNPVWSPNYATFYLASGELRLWTPRSIKQTLYTDRSGMGRGVLMYSTQPGGYLPSRNSETVGWATSQHGYLTFDGAGFLACPTGSGRSFALSINVGLLDPFNLRQNCTAVSVRTIVNKAADLCVYSYPRRPNLSVTPQLPVNPTPQGSSDLPGGPDQPDGPEKH